MVFLLVYEASTVGHFYLCAYFLTGRRLLLSKSTLFWPIKNRKRRSRQMRMAETATDSLRRCACKVSKNISGRRQIWATSVDSAAKGQSPPLVGK